jgi:putative riboflavin transport system substrate-binding protein
MSRRRLAISLVALLLAACSPAASSGPSASAALRHVTLLLGFRPDVQFAPYYVGQQDGYYADAGLEVTIEHKQAPDVQRLVADGQAEFGVADATDVMIARTSGVPVVYVSTLYERFPVAIIGRKGEVPSDPAGLAGKKIGTPGKFGSSWHALLALLSAGGLGEKDVTIREYPQFNQADGLAAGDVDLITGFRNNEPLRLEAQGIAVDLLTIDQIAPLPGPGTIVGQALLDSDPDLVRRFAQATARAQRAVIEDPDLGLEAAKVSVPAIAEDLDTARAVLEATTVLWAGETGFSDGAIDISRWRKAYDIMRRLGFVDGSVPVDQMIAPSIVGGG